MRRQIGHIELGENVFSCPGVVVGGATDQRESGQGHDRIHRAAAIFHEKAFDRRPLIQAAREGGDHAQPLRLECGNDAVIVTGIPGEQIGPQQQETDGAAFLAQGWQAICSIGDATLEARMVDTDIGVVDRRLGRYDASQAAARTVGVTVDQQADHVGDVLFGAGQPIL